ncbi:MAG: hypothetical protein HS126_12500 [Anaerolineales bacterium]|nr:hypothetical protein [Anaerolineales bacterium]
MSFVQIFVEDELNEAYEILAARSLGVDYQRRNQRRRYVQAARLDITEFTSLTNLLDLVTRANRAGSQCVLFIMDEEDYNESPDRSDKLVAFQEAFQQVCAHLANLPDNDILKRVRVTGMICKTCLECWLLAHPQAIVTAVNGPGSYTPSARDTVAHNPRQAREQIAHIVREAGKRTKNQKLVRITGHSVKSLGTKVAAFVEPQEARQRNFSLAYFYDMITCEQSGCERPFPIRA